MLKLPRYEDVEIAAAKLSGEAVRTPLLKCDALNLLTGANVYIKPESLQRTGSFKFRGAYNAISNLNEDERAKGVIASSSGNHAQGIARAAKLFGVTATILMPSDAPKLKIDRTRADGAEVVFYDRETGDREAEARRLVEEKGGVFIHPFENHNVIAGQGTVGLEAAEDMLRDGLQIDRVLVCTGGGGLTAGIALSISKHFPNAKIHSVEPEGFDDYARSLASGERKKNDKTSGSVCDAIITPQPGEASFAINKALLSDGLVISDREAMEAVKFAWQEMKLVVEPGGAAALAGLLQSGQRFAGETVLVTLSGGNVDPDLFARAIA